MVVKPVEIAIVGKDNSGNIKCKYLCDCGKVFISFRYRVRSGHTKSCGCFRSRLIKERSSVHGHNSRGKASPTYVSWENIKQRCLNPNATKYKNYGGRGITVCDRWLRFENFLEDMGERPSLDYSINRIDNDGNYEPGNCEWILKSENSREMQDRQRKNKD